MRQQEILTLQSQPTTLKKAEELLNNFLQECYRCQTVEKQDKIRKAFLYTYHQTNGDLKIIEHSLEVARVISIDIGLGTTSVIAALLHELPDKTEFGIDDIYAEFGQEVGKIIEGFYKIKNTERYFKPDDSENIEIYKSIILNMAMDLRIISLRIADRLVTLRHFEELDVPNKDIIPIETLKIYAPIADVLGSYRVKMELENLAFKYYMPDKYWEIVNQLKSSYRENIFIINKVALPIIVELFKRGYKFKIYERQKSIYSIYRKLVNKNLKSIDEIYDILAFRIIVFPQIEGTKEEKLEEEKRLCKEIGQIIQSMYVVHPDRIRNWIDKPKEGSGYMALHLTVLEPKSKKWVEVQIRGEQMHEIAEFGYAAHWKYKGVKLQLEEFSDKLKILRSHLENIGEDIDKVFELIEPYIPVEKITVYTPDFEEVVLRKGATVLDFAAKIHSDLAKHTAGAVVNFRQTVSPVHKLKHGDVVKVITTDKLLNPEKSWLGKVATSGAKRIIRELLNLKEPKQVGLHKLMQLAHEREITLDSRVLKSLLDKFKLKDKDELYVKIANDEIDKETVRDILSKFRKVNFWNFRFLKSRVSLKEGSYEIATCCMPTEDDEIVAVWNGKVYEIHRRSCRMVSEKLEKGAIVVPVEWNKVKQVSKLYKLKFYSERDAKVLYHLGKSLANGFKIELEEFRIRRNDKDGGYIGELSIYAANDKEFERFLSLLKELNTISKVNVLN